MEAKEVIRLTWHDANLSTTTKIFENGRAPSFLLWRVSLHFLSVLNSSDIASCFVESAVTHQLQYQQQRGSRHRHLRCSTVGIKVGNIHLVERNLRLFRPLHSSESRLIVVLYRIGRAVAESTNLKWMVSLIKLSNIGFEKSSIIVERSRFSNFRHGMEIIIWHWPVALNTFASLYLGHSNDYFMIFCVVIQKHLTK